MNRLHYSHGTETGALFHMIGALSQYGKLGLTAIGNSREEADAIYAARARVARPRVAAMTAAAARSARFYAGLSIAAAVVTIALKAAAWKLTGSVGLLSDAAESVVNLVAALIALWALTVAAKPPDPTHDFGYSKAEYFASGAEGFLILAAAVGIAIAAWERWQKPAPITDAWLGIAVSVAASAVNGAVAVALLRAGQAACARSRCAPTPTTS